jgi:SAM-dependent methyltransferase
MNAYRQNVLSILKEVLATTQPVARVLDFGAGDGWFAAQLSQASFFASICAIDVQRRPHPHFDPISYYDGSRLPFADREFDLSYAIDVLHHCREPRRALDDVLRCTRRHFVIKDHTYGSVLGYLALCALDEIGNRRLGISSSYAYQRGWEWFSALAERGFRLARLVHPAVCHTGILRGTNRLQFVARFTRVDS